MQKKLINVLEKIEPDEIVYIGASSGFFFIGTAQDAINSIDDISLNFLSKMKDRRYIHFNKLDETIENIPVKKRHSPKWVKEARKYARNIEDKCNLIDAIEKDIKTFKMISDRRVIEIFSRIQNDGMCIIVEGTENGAFWSIEEYQNANKEKEDD